MKVNYYADTDSRHIDLPETVSADTVEVSDGVALDYAADGTLVGIDIDNASAKVELSTPLVSRLPARIETDTA